MNLMKRSVPMCALNCVVLSVLFLIGSTSLYGFTTASITLMAYSGDGINTGNARLGANVSIVPTVKLATSNVVSWSLAGAGTLSSSGVYTAPATMPSDRMVTVTAKLVADTAISASYTMYLQNPAPQIRTAFPQSLATATTNPVQVFGNYFVPQSVILINGSAAPTTYVSSTELTTNLSVPDSATGSYTFAVSSPLPGGGKTAGYSLPVALKTVEINAYNNEGVNAHTTRLGLNTQFALSIQGPGNPAATWTVTGGGAINSNGLYQAPTTMPSNPTVTITGTLQSNTAVHASYALSVLNPAPVVNGTSPAKLTPGQQNTVTIQGFGFLPGTTMVVNGSAVTTTYQSPTSVQVNITPSSGTTWMSLSAHNPNPGAAQSPNFWIPVTTGSSASASVSMNLGRWIPQEFVGISHEWGDAQNILGSSQIGTNTIYRQLLKNLMLNGSYPFVIRIGGGSTDATGEPDDRTIPPFKELASAMGVHFTLGVNLGSDNVSLATDQAKAYMSQMPSGSVDALEIGNEPDNYVSLGYRSSGYSFADYHSDFKNWSETITPSLSGPTKFMGPAWGSLNSLNQDLSWFEQEEQPNVGVLSQHYYAGHRSTQASFPSDFLLADSAATQGAASISNYADTVHSKGQKLRIGEINSIDEGGVAGVSDTFSAALWAVDVMFEFLKAGADGVNWHDANNGNPYSMFTFGKADMGGTGVYTLQNLRPLYYGLWFFQEATMHGTRLLSMNVNSNANIKTWATIDKQNVIRIAVINKDKSFDGTLNISVPGYSGTAQVTRLTAPNYQATDGVSFGGQTFDGSIDGTPLGSPANETLAPSNGTYNVSVQPTSAVLLTINQ
jgi:Glycosyl hydrolase family 79 C-terminal beta domain/IPT/TIG domain